jgi:hypothetical protein
MMPNSKRESGQDKQAKGAQIVASVLLSSLILVSFFLATYGQQVFQITFKSGGGFVNSKLTVIVRHLGNPMPDWQWNTVKEVDWWVANHTWIKGGAVLIDVEDVAPILWFNQPGYNGYKFTTTQGTWSTNGWSFQQLKTLIDRLHYHQVKVVLAILGFAKPKPDWASGIWEWISSTHRELFYTRRDGSLYGISNNAYSYPAPLAWFKNFTSDDTASGAKAGTRLIDLFVTRLQDMIRAGLEWDGIFGSEGWGSVGVWGGGASYQWIDASAQLINEWASAPSEHHPSGFPPTGWNSWTNLQRAEWINSNANPQFREYWGMRFARDFFKKQHDAIKAVRPSESFFGVLFTPDDTWMDQSRESSWGGWSPDVGYNATYLAQYCSEPTFYYSTGNEHCHTGGPYSEISQREMGKYNAYVAASIKSSNTNFHVVPMLIVGYDYINPLWIPKQTYLAQLQEYVWVNKTRYNAVDPTVVVVQYPDRYYFDGYSWTGYFRPIWNELFDWIGSVLEYMKDASPQYLGPTYVFASTRNWAGLVESTPGWGWRNSLNWTTAQWIESDQINSGNLNWTMGTVFLDRIWLDEVGQDVKSSVRTVISQAFSNGSLNVVVYLRHYYLGSDYLSTAEKNAYKIGTVSSTLSSPSSSTILSGLSDQYAQWIASGYTGKQYFFDQSMNMRIYMASKGFVNIANATGTNLVQLGIYYSPTSARFLYGIYFDHLPKAIIQRALYWVSNSPVNTSEPLLDLKVFKRSDGTLLIPMMNVKNLAVSGSSQHYGETLSSVLGVDSGRLGLGSPSQYVMYWASDLYATRPMSISDWNNIPITLNGMADVLVIKPQL